MPSTSYSELLLKQGPCQLRSARCRGLGTLSRPTAFCPPLLILMPKCLLKKNALVTIPSKISGGMDLPTDTFANRGGSVSMLSYQPKSQMDYGTVLCAARNSVGSQLVPCVYHVIPAGTHSCSYRKEFIFQITLCPVVKASPRIKSI